jgi:bleomycin hydrolase
MSFSISAADLAAFHEDYAGRKDSAVLERAVTKNGVKAASFDWHSKPTTTNTFRLTFPPVTLPTKSNPDAAGCLRP